MLILDENFLLFLCQLVVWILDNLLLNAGIEYLEKLLVELLVIELAKLVPSQIV